MDMMQIRKMVMGQMANSIFEKMFDVLSSAYVSEYTREITFQNVTLPNNGMVILVSNPPGNPTTVATQDAGQIVDMLMLSYNNGSLRNKYLSTVKKSGGYDYWGDSTITIDGTNYTIKLSSNAVPKFSPGFTYYLLHVKQ